MSKMSRFISRLKRDVNGGTKWYHDVFDAFWFWWDHSLIGTSYYNCKNFVRNLYLFIGLAWGWRPWDSHYTITVLIKLLKAQAPCLKNGLNVRSEEVYRRCMTAAGKLDKAYNMDMDKTILYLLEKNRWYTEDTGNGLYEMKTNYITDKRIYDGMYKVARKRSDKAEAQAKKEAWAYLHKYIEHFWD